MRSDGYVAELRMLAHIGHVGVDFCEESFFVCSVIYTCLTRVL